MRTSGAELTTNDKKAVVTTKQTVGLFKAKDVQVLPHDAIDNEEDEPREGSLRDVDVPSGFQHHLLVVRLGLIGTGADDM